MKTTGMMKSAVAAVLALTLAACGTATSAGTPAEPAGNAGTEEKTTYKVAIVKQLDHASLDEIANAIAAELDALAEKNGVVIDYGEL